ncbi:MAG: NUDIX hydrolase [Eubacterium sp.]|nr:NUDIX hydrolase [Eubacterium sp.]
MMEDKDKDKDKALSAEDKELVWEELSTEHIVTDEWIDFRRSSFRFPDGSIYEPYYSYTRRNYVVIVASDEEGRFICVKQFRQGIREVTTEFPAGCIEDNESDALLTAKRELREETGYESDEWEHLITVPSNATIADNYAHLYRAKNCRKVSGQDLDDMEFLNVKRYSTDEIEELISSGHFQQAVHMLAWLLSVRR